MARAGGSVPGARSSSVRWSPPLAVPAGHGRPLEQSLESGRAAVRSELKRQLPAARPGRPVGRPGVGSRRARTRGRQRGRGRLRRLRGPARRRRTRSSPRTGSCRPPRPRRSCRPCTGSDQRAQRPVARERVPSSGVPPASGRPCGHHARRASSSTTCVAAARCRARSCCSTAATWWPRARRAATTPPIIAAAIGDRTGRIQVGDRSRRSSPPSDGVPLHGGRQRRTPASAPDHRLFLLILLAGALVAGLLVTVVARGLSQPLTDLTEAAERVASGDLDTAITPDDRTQRGRPARRGVQPHDVRAAAEHVRRWSRAARTWRSLERIGDTLTNTHDLDGLLQVVLETAVVTLQARAGVVLYGAPDQLQLVAEHGLHEAGLPAPGRHHAGRRRPGPRRGLRRRRARPPRLRAARARASADRARHGRHPGGAAAQHGRRRRGPRALRPGRRPALRRDRRGRPAHPGRPGQHRDRQRAAAPGGAAAVHDRRR